MPEQAPSIASAGSPVDSGPKLTSETIDAILQDFRTWLERAAQQSAPSTPDVGGGKESAQSAFSWQMLAAEFTALRQEVNLQTRASRAQLEHNAGALQQLENAAQALEEARSETDREDKSDGILRPLLKTLVDVYDALALARREVERVEKTMIARAGLDASRMAKSRPWWRSWQAGAVVPAAEGQDRQVLSSILVGYKMGLQRLERSLRQHQLEPIECVGEPFDPECMEVVEVVNEPGRQGTEVVEEVRRGYRWRGRLFRSAQVRVSRP
jgi:molecular chaperone GrpE